MLDRVCKSDVCLADTTAPFSEWRLDERIGVLEDIHMNQEVRRIVRHGIGPLWWWLVLLAFLGTAYGETRTEKQPVPIGVLYPLSGAASSRGEDALEGARLAISEVNLGGGVKGRPLAAVVGDTAGDPETALSEARRLVHLERVTALLGILDDEAAFLVSELAGQQQVPFIGAGHGDDRLLLERFHPFYFRVNASNHQLTAATALYAAQQPWQRFAVIGPDVPSSRRALESFKTVLLRHREEVQWVGTWWTHTYDYDFAPLIRSLKTSGADAVLCLYEPGCLKEFIRQGALLGLFPNTRLICPLNTGDYAFLREMGDRLPDGMVLAAYHHLNWPETPGNRDFIHKFKGRTGRYPSQSAAAGYAGVHLLAKAFQESGWPVDSRNLARVLEQTSVPCPWDPPGFTSYIRSDEHQMVMAVAVGEVMSGTGFPPASKVLENWMAAPPHDILLEAWDIFEARFPKPK